MAITKAIMPARLMMGGMPQVRSQKYKTSEAIIKGSVIGQDGNGELVLLTSDTSNPADHSIIGVAAEAAGSRPGFEISHDSRLVATTGRKQEISYFVANHNEEFIAQISADGSTVTTPTQALVGDVYKLSKAANGLWYVDSSDVDPDNVIITDVDLINDFVFFKFRADAIIVES